MSKVKSEKLKELCFTEKIRKKNGTGYEKEQIDIFWQYCHIMA